MKFRTIGNMFSCMRYKTVQKSCNFHSTLLYYIPAYVDVHCEEAGDHFEKFAAAAVEFGVVVVVVVFQTEDPNSCLQTIPPKYELRLEVVTCPEEVKGVKGVLAASDHSNYLMSKGAVP